MTRGQAKAYRTKIIEADEVKADLLAVAAHIPKGQRKKYGAEIERILAKYDE